MSLHNLYDVNTWREIKMIFFIKIQNRKNITYLFMMTK